MINLFSLATMAGNGLLKKQREKAGKAIVSKAQKTYNDIKKKYELAPGETINEENWWKFQDTNPDAPRYNAAREYFRTGMTTSEQAEAGMIPSKIVEIPNIFQKMSNTPSDGSI